MFWYTFHDYARLMVLEFLKLICEDSNYSLIIIVYN